MPTTGGRDVIVRAHATSGVSPKVAAFVASVGGPGLVLLILGLALGDDTIKTVGLSLLGGGLIGGGAGAVAKPGTVVVKR